MPGRPGRLHAAPGVVIPDGGGKPDEVTVVTVARQVAPSVVSVQQNDRFGSGVVIRREEVILTNAPTRWAKPATCGSASRTGAS